MNNSRIVKNAYGLPTKPDVAKIIDKYGIPKEGILITYNEIAEVINESKDAARYRTVTDAWVFKTQTQTNSESLQRRHGRPGVCAELLILNPIVVRKRRRA